MRDLILMAAVLALLLAMISGCTAQNQQASPETGNFRTENSSGQAANTANTGNANQTQTVLPPVQNTTGTQPANSSLTVLPVEYFREDIQGPSGPITQITAVLDKGATPPLIIGNYGLFAKRGDKFSINILGAGYVISNFDILVLYNSQGRPLPVVENMTLLRDDGMTVKVQNLVLAENNGNYRIEELGIGYPGSCLGITGTQRFGIGKFGDMCIDGVKIYAQDVVNVAGTGKYAQLEFAGADGSKDTRTVYIGNSVSDKGVSLRFVEMDAGADQGPVAIFEVQ